MIDWTLETRKIKELKNHPKNARQLTKQQSHHLTHSIKKFGLADKPIINRDNTVIGGHQRLKILKKLGHKEVQCWVPQVQLDEKDLDEFNIRLNKNTGEWDWDTLANEWDALDLLEYGFSESELVGKFDDKEEAAADSKKKSSKKTTCPACGHEF
jgi:site-specific DNA-methyltransferase (adenine-specific)